MNVLQINPRTLNAYSATRQPASFRCKESPLGVGNRSSANTGYSAFDIFQWLSMEAQEAFTLASRRRRFPDGCRIHSQSESGSEMYRIVSGSVRMSVVRHDGREVVYLMLEAGDCFGICSLIDGAPRSYTTSAKGDVELQVVQRDTFELLRAQHVSFGDGLIQVVSRHMRLLSEFFASANLDEISCRVAQRLVNAHKLSVINGRTMRYTLCLDQSELALMVGASRQAVNRVLRKFQDDGLIAIQYGRVQIHDIDRLKTFT